MLSSSNQRDPSTTRGRGPASVSSKPPLPSLAQRALSPQAYGHSHDNLASLASRSGTPTPASQPLERRPSTSYGHHRQTSVVPTTRTHSRQNSSVQSPAIGGTLKSPPMGPTAEMGYSALPIDSFEFRSPQQSSAATFQPFNSFSSMSTLAHGDSPSISDSISSTIRPYKPHGPSRTESTSSVSTVTRKSSTRPRRDQHGRSGSNESEEKTVGEYALQHLFKAFKTKADVKIDTCVTKIPHEIASVEDVCGVGVDPEFDALIQALGHISRQRPKPLVDTAMLWRGWKAQDFQEAQAKWKAIKSSAEARQQVIQEGRVGDSQVFATYYERVERADKRVVVAIFLICRILMQVYSQCEMDKITPYLDNKIEDLLFEQMSRLDPDKVAQSSLHRSNWLIYSQLLGLISFKNFQNVSARFLKLLSQVQQEVGPKGALANANSELRVELVVRGMSYLCIRTAPDAEWHQSVDLLLNVSRLFAESHGQTVKHAYCSVLETLILSVMSATSQQFSGPKWKEVLVVLNGRLGQLVQKPRYWLEAFPLQVLLVCASPSETFTTQWSLVVNGLQAKLKDHTTRSVALQSICRLVWMYLHRSKDPITTMRKLEDVVKIVLPSGKKTYLSTDPAFADPTVEFIRLVGYRFPEFCFKSIIFPLLNNEMFASGREIRPDQLDPQRMVIGIRAFLAVITDLEAASQKDAEAPKFPVFDRQIYGYESIPRIKSPTKLSEEKSEQSKIGQPVRAVAFGESIRYYYTTFCDILGKITLICDNAFGGQATLDEKLNAAGGISTPKTPLTEGFTFGRLKDKDDHPAQLEAKQGFYDLLHVAVQALPRFMGKHIPYNQMINLLCTGTAHVQTDIAASSANSLKAIARQSHAQQVTIGFARFIFNFDARYSTMRDEGLLGPGHIENTLQLYLELLSIWIEEVKHKTQDSTASLEVTSVGAFVEEIESHGIFFLCSQSRRVRSFAVQVLRLVTEFDKVLKKDGTRVINIMSRELIEIISPDDSRLTVAERSRLQKGKRKSSVSNGLIELCSSEVSYDSTLWFKVFPNLIAQAFSTCPFAIALGREIVCLRLLQMRTTINAMDDAARMAQVPGIDRTPVKAGAQSEVFLEQWKLYLVMACTTTSNAGAQTQSQLAQHVRNKSRPPQSGENFNSARSLFAYMIPLLGSASPSIREAVVTAMGSINKVLYRTLLESLQYAVTSVNDEAKAQARIGSTHQRAGSLPRSRKHDDMRTETTHVYKLTSKFLHEDDILKDEWIVNNLIRYTDDMRIFLSDAEVQNDWYFQGLRRYYCGLLEEVFEGVNRTKDLTRWMTFEARKAAFTLIEDWCGYSPNQSQIAAREESMKASVINNHSDTNFTASIEIEKRNLRMAALSAMASLCAGPISIQMEKTVLQFDARRMLEWIDQILGDPSDKMHAIGRRAMKNLIKHNTNFPVFLERVIDRCIPTERPKAMESYFDVVFDVLGENKDYNIPFWRIVGMLVIMLGSEKGPLRTRAVKLLRSLEEHHLRNTPGRSSKLQNFDISVSDKTAAVYKLAQYRISDRLSKAHTELAFFVFSQFCLQFKMTKGDYQRNIVAAMLPWVQALELEVDTNGAPTQQTYMVLSNLLEITTKSSTVLHNEVQALWQALANGVPGNVQLVLNFVITLCMERREQSFVDYARQIVVYLSSTGQKVVDFLLLQITPKNMVQTEKPMQPVLPNSSGFPYVADLAEVLPIGGKQQGFSLGQLSLILMVDLIVADVKLAPENVPLLLQICSVLWDHHFGLVQEQAREMLVHLIHELIINKFDRFGDKLSADKKNEIEEFVESIRQSKSEVVWLYADNNANNDDSDSMRVPDAMKHVTSQVISLFSFAYPNIHEQWAKVSLSWATSCSVRHLACRSFQIFRCVFASLDGTSLADILARLSNTVADETPEVQGFAMEILCTLKTIIRTIEARELLRYPQLFYVTCACLSTVNEREFIEVLRMLDALLDKFNLGDPAVLRILSEAKPSSWSGEFDGLLPNVYKGLKSEAAMPKTRDIIIKTASLPEHNLIGEGSRFLFAILAFLPAYMSHIDTQNIDLKLLESARTLASTAEMDGRGDIATVLQGIANQTYTSSREMVKPMMRGLAQAFFPKYQVQCLIFLMGILSNKASWCKLKTLDMLQVVVPEIDLRSAEVISYGSDLISPLLRLLQTEYCPPALELMDIIMKRNPAPVEPQNVRMSMIVNGSVKEKKVYEKTKSLYGIPDDSGWSVPMPAAHAKTTRENVHNVFYTCAALNSTNTETPSVTPDIEFDRDEYQERQYFRMQRSDTGLSEGTTTAADSFDSRTEVEDAPASDLAAKLDSLDDLFDDDDPADFGHRYADSHGGGYGSDTDAPAAMHSMTFRSDRPAPPPRATTSLSRNASVSSLHHPQADRAPMNPMIMTPGAFFDNPAHAGDTRSVSSSSTIRPNFHSRSVTSPSHANHAHTNTMQSVHEFLSDDNSDDDYSTSKMSHMMSPAFADESPTHGYSPSAPSNMVRSGGFSSSNNMGAAFASNPKRSRSTRQQGIETKQGDLLRGSRARSKSTALRSPEVPKVPDAYLQEMKSPEL